MDKAINMPRLVRSDGREIKITKHFIIGRSLECSLQLEKNAVSRQHALLEMVGQRVILKDLGSRNGTWLNGQKISTAQELQDGDRLRIGKTEYIFRAASVPFQEEIPPILSNADLAESTHTEFSQNSISMSLVRSNNGAEFGFNHDIVIGREPSNDLVIQQDNFASLRHARIECVERQAIIRDLESRNGTWVNGNRIIRPTPLEHGDRIRIGHAEFRLRMEDRPLPPDYQSVVQPAEIKETVTAGMSGEDVKRIMGEPQKITRGKDSVLSYEYPAVKIGLREDKVVIIQYTTELASIYSPASQLESSISINSTCEHVRKHSGCLTAFLAAAVIGNAVLALLTWVMASELPHSMEGLALFSGCLNAAGIVFAIAIFKWQRWGVYGYMGCAIISLLINLLLGDIIMTIRGLIPIVLLAILIRPSWDKLD